MNILKSISLKDLKIGKFYFEEIELEEDWTHKKFYIITIVKIQKIQSEPDSKKLIVFSYSSLKDYNIFSKIIDFDTVWDHHSDEYNFFEKHIQLKDSNANYYYYKFNKKWFLRNKKKILLYMNCYNQTEKSFPKIFKEIESEEK